MRLHYDLKIEKGLLIVCDVFISVTLVQVIETLGNVNHVCAVSSVLIFDTK